MLVAAKFGDPVLGVDIHMVLVPAPPAPPIPTPLPHPFIGVVFDPIGLAMGCLISAVFGGGGPVLINSMPCGNTGTEVKGVPHFPTPPGISFAPNDIPGNEGVLFMGSQTVTMGGDSIARLTDMVISCNFPVNLPTSVCLAVPMGPPVLVGGPPAINFMAAVTQMIRTKWVSDQLHALLKAKPGSRLSKVICFFTGHPVDVMTGEVLTSQTDFELPGPMPLVFERNYYSRSTYDGPLGPGWHHPLDASVTDEGWRLTLRLEDGRERWHAPMPVGASHWDPIERYTLARTAWGYSLALPDGRTLSFARVEGREGFALVRVEDRCGNAMRLAYEAGRLAELIDCAERRIAFHHRGDGRLSSVVLHRADGAQRALVRYAYDAEGHLASATDAMGGAFRYEYRGGVLTRETNRNGLSFHFEYDWEHPEGWCVRTWGDGGIYDHRITYDKTARVTVVEDSRGARRQYFGDPRGLVIKRIDETGGAWSYEYDENYRKVAEEDPNGARSSWRYDDRGDPVEQVDALGNALRMRYDALGAPLEVLSRGGLRSRAEWDARALPLWSEDPSGAVFHYHHDARGNLIAVDDPSGRRLTWDYRDDGFVLRAVDAEGGATEWSRDDLGRPTRYRDAAGAVVEVEWDELDRVVALHRASGVTRFSYDPEGNLVRSVDPKGRETRTRHAGNNKPVETRSPDGETLRFEYDSEENLTAVINARGERTTFKHDLAGRLVRQRRFDGRELKYRYDRAGRCVETVDHRGRRTVYTRDALGRVIKVRSSDGRETRYEYDADGALRLADNGECALRLTFDDAGRLIREEVDGAAVESRYDPLGNRVAKATTLGHRASFEYDGNGRLRAASLNPDARWMHWDAAGIDAAPRMARPWGLSLERGLDGAERARNLPGGITTSWSIDEEGRPTSLKVLRGAEELIVQSLRWGAGDQLEAIIDVHRGPTRYQHDPRGALASALFPEGDTQHRARDEVGDVFRSADRSDRRYEPGGALVEAAGTRYIRDTEGRLVEKVRPDGARWRYTWDGADQLRAVTTPDGREVRFRYDPLGRRVSKSVDGVETRFVWDRDQVVHELTPEGAVVTWLTADGEVAPLAREEGDARWSVVTDHLGTPQCLFDEAGELAWRAQLDLYGVPRTDVARIDCPWRWPGQYEDAETGLHYNRFRYYDPEAGQYISPDPLGIDADLPLYAYVPDPLAAFDFLGLIEGGSYRTVRSARSGGEVHHTPAYAAYKNVSGAPTHGGGSALHMSTADHYLTSSHGRQGTAGSLYRAQQTAHMNAGNWHKAVEMDVVDITTRFPNKYDQGLREMLDHHEAQGRITRRQKNAIKKKCGL